MEKVPLEDLDRDTQFQVKLQIALRNNAIRIRELNHNHEKFIPYILERENKIRTLLGKEGEFIISEDGRNIFP